jgi:hypothetical protein
MQRDDVEDSGAAAAECLEGAGDLADPGDEEHVDGGIAWLSACCA